VGNNGESKDVVHQPVMLDEVVEWLRGTEGGTYIDCTLGLGGHTKALLNASTETRVVGIDRDPEALEFARTRLSIFGERVRLVHANFEDIGLVLESEEITDARGILADLGVSSLQLEKSERGFSFTMDAPLDMRMDPNSEVTAAELVNGLSERDLADTIFEYGEERGSRKIARAIVRQRAGEAIETTKQLAEIVVRALNIRGHWRIHPATRTFQALRIAVNEELIALERFIPAGISALERGGRLAIISFHSLEDRIVKRSYLRESGQCICEKRGPQPVLSRKMEAPAGAVICDRCGASKRGKVLTRRPLRPKQDEMERNPRSRSSLLRVCERV
jgi:16S rRNA (cytosine1402-N4)-methyltransferase